jgi:hypothetical protein
MWNWNSFFQSLRQESGNTLGTPVDWGLSFPPHFGNGFYSRKPVLLTRHDPRFSQGTSGKQYALDYHTDGGCMREAGARVERATLQGFEDNCVLSRTHLRNRAARHDRAAHRSSPAAKTLSTIVVLQHAAWCNCLVSIACSVCVCVCVCVWSHACDNSYTRCTSTTSDRTSAGCDGGGAAQSHTSHNGAEHGSVTIPVFR